MELERKLSDRFPDREIETVLAELVDADLLSDARFAQAYIDARRDRGFGPVRIRYELLQRGIEADLIETYLDTQAADWARRAVVVYDKKFAGTAPEERKERAGRERFLHQRGFTEEQIRHVRSHWRQQT